MRVSVNPLLRRVSWDKLRVTATEIRPYLHSVRREAIIAVICSVGAVVTAIARPWPIKIVFDYALLPDQRVKWVYPYAMLKGYGAMGVVTFACVLLLIVSLLWALFSYIQRLMISTAGRRVTFQLRKRMFAHLQRLSLVYHRSQHMGDLLLRATGDLNVMRDMFVDAIIDVFSEGLILVGMFIVMAFMDWQLTLVSMAVLPLLSLVVFGISRDLQASVRRSRSKEGRVATQLGGMLQAVAVIQVFGRERYEDDKFNLSNRRDLSQGLRTVRLEAKLERISEIVITLGTICVLYVGVRRVISGILTPGDLIVFTSYLAASYKPLRRIAKISTRVTKATACAERVFAVLHTDQRIKDRRDARPAGRFQGRVRFKHVSFSYQKGGAKILNDVSFAARPGQTIAIVGPNGAGKSTLCALIPRLFDPDEGTITIDGEKIRHLQLASLREQIGVVLQQPTLFEGTIASNIAYGKPDASQAEIEAAARAADAHHFIMDLPERYETHVGERGDTLSGGQRQKISIARAMIKAPSILILDEPTAALDASSAAQVNATLMRLELGKTTFRVGHRLSELSHSDVIVVIEDGRVTAMGTHDALIAQPGWYRDVYLLQAGEAAGHSRDGVTAPGHATATTTTVVE